MLCSILLDMKLELIGHTTKSQWGFRPETNRRTSVSLFIHVNDYFYHVSVVFTLFHQVTLFSQFLVYGNTDSHFMVCSSCMNTYYEWTLEKAEHAPN